MRRIHTTLATLVALAVALLASCTQQGLDDQELDDQALQSALEAIADDIGAGEDGSLGTLDDSDEEPAFGSDVLDDELDDADDAAGEDPNAEPPGDGTGARCGEGVMVGHWVRTRERAGAFAGRWHESGGEGPHGWVAGRFGVRPDGQQQFHGKAIDAMGRFRAFVAGTWGDGELQGHLFGRDGVEVGQMRGRYSTGDQPRNRFRGQYRHRCRAGEPGGECDPEVGDCDQDRAQDHEQNRDCDPEIGECEPGNGDRDRDCNPEESDCEPDHDRDCDPETAGCDEAGPDASVDG